jgi:uncharacterized cofD-like protein
MSEIDPINVVAFGGGHGLAATVEALDHSEYVHTDAFTTVVDSGSASGRLRVLAGEVGDSPYGFGDLRNNLGRSSQNLGGELFGIRFDREASPDTVRSLNEDLRLATGWHHQEADLVGESLDDTIAYGELLAESDKGLRGHTYGNLVLAGLASRHGLIRGVEIANRWLHTRTHVQSITDTPHHMHMWDRGEVYHTEEVIDDRQVEDPETARIWLDDGTEITPGAYEAIAKADILVVAPGSLWTSTLPVLAVNGVAQAIREQAGRSGTSRLIVANLVHEANAGTMPLRSYRRKIEEVTGSRFGIIHNTAVEAIPPEYQALHAGDDDLEGAGYGAKLVSTRDIKHDENDPLAHRRNGVSHDGPALAGAIIEAHQLTSSRA